MGLRLMLSETQTIWMMFLGFPALFGALGIWLGSQQ
jgi:hypothetical protein